MDRAYEFATTMLAMSKTALRNSLPTIRNILTSLLEAAIVLAVTQLPLLLGLISHVMSTDGETFSVDTAIQVFGRTFSPGDILSYVAGILGSSMAFFVVKLGVFKRKPIMIVPLVVAPILILFFAAPVYIQDIDGQVGNADFVSNYIKFLLYCSVAVWLFSLYQSKVLFDVGLPSKSGAKNIVDEIEGKLS
ncbi:MAG: hypothetical protein ABJN52_14570 [Litorimonas sp.]